MHFGGAGTEENSNMLKKIFSFTTATKIHDGTAPSFLEAMVRLGENPDMKSVNTILSSFSELNHQEQEIVMESPKVYLFSIIHARNTVIVLKIL